LRVTLALGASVAWGLSAFVAGLTTRRHSSIVVVWGTQLLGLAILLPVVVALGVTAVTAGDVIAGLVAGVGTAVGLGSLYRGLGVGRMGVVAPTAAVVSVGIPAIVDYALGERLPLGAQVGLVVGLAAVVLLSVTLSGRFGKAERDGLAAIPAPTPHPDGESGDRQATRQPTGTGVGYGLLAGVGFSIFYVAFDFSAAEAGLWPLVAARFSAIGILTAVLRTRGLAVAPPWQTDRLALVGIGVFDLLGSALYVIAVGIGPLSLVVVLSALYPVVTVGLARIVLGEELGWKGVAGVTLAMIAVALILGS
jgi:uncharacterized membrane protein